MNRRLFLKNSGNLVLGSSALSGLASIFPNSVLGAIPLAEPPHFFLVIRVHGGMDSTLGLNPWLLERPDTKDLYLDQSYETLASVDGTEINLGPSALGLRPHVQDLSVINGIFMGTTDLGHPSAQNYITTAKTSPNAPHFIAELAENYRLYKADKRETVLFNGGLNTFDLDQLSRLPLQLLVGNDSGLPYGDNPNSNAEHIPLLTGINSAFGAAHNSLILDLEKKRRLDTILASFKNESDELLPEDGVVASFASDFARFAQVDWNEQGALDSHINFIDNHQQGQKNVWDRVSSLIEKLKKTTYLNSETPLINMTTVAVITEFSRLPFLNMSNGKDHNYFDNSILLAGKGIQGGTSIGGHHLFHRDNKRKESQLSGCHIDFKTGNIIKNGYLNTSNVNQIKEDRDVELIRPENILRTLGSVFNVDYEFMRLFSKDTAPLPRILK